MILDGKALASRIKARIAASVEESVKKGVRRPGLALVLVGDDPASSSYVNGKVKDAESVGFRAFPLRFPADVSEETLLRQIEILDSDPDIDGIMVQLPLPTGIDTKRVLAAVAPHKDVDGFHPLNVAALRSGDEGIVPCTPRGILMLLDDYGIPVEGKRAVVIGRSDIVGRPVAALLLGRNATVTVAHSFTPDLKEVVRRADILVVAAGQMALVTPDMVKPGAAVIDVGINRDPFTGRLRGDVDFEGCLSVAGAITPVPGGIGPLTKACLMLNTFEAYSKNK